MKISHPYSIYPNFKYGKARPSNHQWKGVCLHWSAGHGFAQETANYINRSNSGGWYNLVIDKDITFMCVDPSKKTAGHARPFNEELIGICISQPVVYLPGALRIGQDAYLKQMNRFHSKLISKGYKVQIIEYDDAQYPYVFTLDQNLSDAVAELTEQLCDEFNINKNYLSIEDKEIISHPNVTFNDASIGVMHHHHLTARKFDCVPWLPQLNESFKERNFEIISNEEVDDVDLNEDPENN